MDTVLQTAAYAFTDHEGLSPSAEAILARIEGLAYCLTDEQGRLLEVNDAFEEMTGYRRSELLGEHFTIMVAEDQRQHATVLHNGFIVGVLEAPSLWRARRKDGTELRIRTEAIRCVQPGGAVRKLTLVERRDRPRRA